MRTKPRNHDLDNNRLQRLAINEQGFVFDPQTGDSFTVNPTGKFILQELIDGHNEESIVKKLAATFAVEINEARHDLRDFTHLLKVLDLT